jgi:hypothetical protein
MFELKAIRWEDFDSFHRFCDFCEESGVPIWVDKAVFWDWLGNQLELQIPVFKNFVSK